MKSLHRRDLLIHIPLLLILTAVGFWLRFANLDAINFYNDEYFQFETAVGWMETGEYRQYNFYTEEVEEEYTRAKPFMWQLAQSMSVLGINETGARMPAVLWGALLIPLIIITTLIATRNPWVAYGAGILVLFDNFMIEMSRFTRMYTMVFVLTVAIVFLFYKWMTSEKRRQQWCYAISTAIVWLINLVVFRELAFALAIGIGIYIAIRSVMYLWKKSDQDKRLVYALIIGSALALIGVIVHYAGWHFIPVGAFIIRDLPHYTYLHDIFSELHIPQFGFFFLLMGIIYIKKLNSYSGLVSVVSLSLLGYFIYLSHRWEAKRYIGFLIPLFYIIISLGIYHSVRLLTSFLPVSRVSKIIIGTVFFILVGPWISFPGLPRDNFLVQQAYADKSHEDLDKANVEVAYDFASRNYTQGETVFIQNPRYYYWPDNTIPVQELGEYKSLAFEEYVDRLKKAESGWVIYNATKTRHLEKKIRKYNYNRFEYFYELDDTLVFVFHYTPEDL